MALFRRKVKYSKAPNSSGPDVVHTTEILILANGEASPELPLTAIRLCHRGNTHIYLPRES
jgi:hypothetical protein